MLSSCNGVILHLFSKDTKHVDNVQFTCALTYAVISNGHILFLPMQSPLDRAQAAKNKGNKYFKAGKYENAIQCYTEAIALCPTEQKTDLSTFYQNRAAAYEQQVGKNLCMCNLSYCFCAFCLRFKRGQ